MAEDAGDERTGRRGRRHLPRWQEALLLVAVALVLAVVVKSLFAQAFYIPSRSMEPGLVEDDRILVQKVSYWGGGSPQRGDVVVFEDPGHWLGPAEAAGPSGPVAGMMARVGLYPEGGHLVKRVIGVAGDTVHCCDEQGRIEVNGAALDEDDYLSAAEPLACNGPEGPGSCDWTAGPVPEGHLFVMGDNRGSSADSSHHLCADDSDCRHNAYVPVQAVVGKVLVLLWPAGRFGFLHRPDTFADVPDPVADAGGS